MIYFIQQRSHGPIKIGATNNIKKRLSSLQVGNPERLYVRAVIKHGTTVRELHNRFAHLRLEGEWFKPHSELLDYIGEIESDNKPTSEIKSGKMRECRVCGLRYDPRDGTSYSEHRSIHDKIRNTRLPFPFVEYLKNWGGYIAAHGMLGAYGNGKYDKEAGRRLYAFACWIDSNDRLENPDNFERFMADRFDEFDKETQ